METVQGSPLGNFYINRCRQIGALSIEEYFTLFLILKLFHLEWNIIVNLYAGGNNPEKRKRVVIARANCLQWQDQILFTGG